MSIYKIPDLNSNIGSVTPSYIHKKTNSVNFSSNPNRYLQENMNIRKKVTIKIVMLQEI